jgi:hypothetical protein
MLILIDTPDCFSHMASRYLSPFELQTVRCVSKGLNKATTNKIKHECVQNTVSRYNRAVRMPNGAIRIFTRLGSRMFDLYAVEPAAFTVCSFDTTAKTPKLRLDKFDGRPAQIGGMACVGKTANATNPSRKDIMLKGNAAVIDAKEIRITDVHEFRLACGTYSTAIIAKMRFDGEGGMLYVRYMFLSRMPATIEELNTSAPINGVSHPSPLRQRAMSNDSDKSRSHA